MSTKLGLAVLQKDYNESRIPVMEHLGGLSRKAIIHFTGIDLLATPDQYDQAYLMLSDIFDVDLKWGLSLPHNQPGSHPPIYDWDDPAPKFDEQGHRLVQWGVGHAGVQEDGRHFLHIPQMKSAEEALSIEPLAYFPKTVEEYRVEFQTEYDQSMQLMGDHAYTIPHHYTTCFHWALAIFGFELLCEIGMQEDRFGELMTKFAEISLRITTAWSQVQGLKIFILHDDLTMTSGPIFHPDWYRRHIFCHYPAIFKPFLNKNIPILFTSDGDCSVFADDIFEAGADGLNFEYSVDLARLAKDYPDKLLIGNLNSATLTNGPIELIKAQTLACIEAGKPCRRFVMNVGGGMTHNMSIENLEAYLAYRKKLCREARK